MLSFIIFLGFQKNEYFWGYEDFVDIWGGGVSQNLTIFRGHFYAFYGVFLGQCTEFGIVFGANLGRRFGTSKMHLSPPVA